MQELTWNGLNIRYKFVKSFSPATEKIQGFKMSHIEIYCDQDNPVTDTGYKSVFIPYGDIVKSGGVEDFIIEGFDEAATSKNWKTSDVERRQMSLF